MTSVPVTESCQMKNIYVLLAALGWAAHSFAQTAPAPAQAPPQTGQVSAAGGASRGAGAMSAVVEYGPTIIFYIASVAVVMKAINVETTTANHH